MTEHETWAEERRREDEELILVWAVKYWPNVTRLEAYESGPGKKFGPNPVVECSISSLRTLFRVLTDDGDCVAISFMDPDECAPWFKPTGSSATCPQCRETFNGLTHLCEKCDKSLNVMEALATRDGENLK